MRISFQRVRESAIPPRYMSAGAAGMDVSCALDEPLVLAPMERGCVPTGWKLAIPEGFEVQVRPRSGRALREGLTVANAPGTIDSDFRGEVQVILVNLGERPVTIAPGDRIAQFVVAPVARAEVQVVDGLEATARGDGGFGSTGTGA